MNATANCREFFFFFELCKELCTLMKIAVKLWYPTMKISFSTSAALWCISIFLNSLGFTL